MLDLEAAVAAQGAKAVILQLLNYAEQVLEHDAKVGGKTLDEAEMADADAEDAFEEVRGALHKAENAAAMLD